MDKHGDHGKHDSHDAHADHDEHHPAPVPRDPELPTISQGSLSFFAAGVIVVFTVSLLTLL